MDLSYITENVIAMGFPSSGTAGLYRNKMKDVQRFFQTYHEGCYKVYNLCSEKSYDSSMFECVGYFPFDDHDPCPLETMVDFCEDAAAFLAKSTEHTIAIHCRGGKGRTGLLVCVLVLSSQSV